MNIVPLRSEHVDGVAALHTATLTGLITELGPPTARVFYGGSAESALALGFVAEENGRVIGFVLGSTSPRALKRDVVSRHPLAAAVAVSAGAITHPRAIGWLMKSAGGPDEGSYDSNAPELTYLGVAAEARGHGVGRQLVNAFTEALRARNVESYELSVDEDNASAISFYQRTGFTEVGRYREFGRVHLRLRRNTGVSA